MRLLKQWQELLARIDASFQPIGERTSATVGNTLFKLRNLRQEVEKL